MVLLGVRPSDAEEAGVAAAALAEHLAAGGELPRIETRLPLEADEVLHVAIDATCAWYGPAETTYDWRRLLVFGSTPLLALSSATSAIGNHRRRRDAAAASRPQWRPLGSTQVLLTNRRLLVRVDAGFVEIPLDDVARPAATASHGEQLEVRTVDGTVLHAEGPWVPYLATALDAAS